jgi:MoaA/NifB/PqqE/SkfB family radical SAM enzyme
VRSVGQDVVGNRRALPGYGKTIGEARKKLYPCFSRTCQLRCDYCVANMHRKSAQNRPSLLAEIGDAAYLALLRPILSRYRPMEIFLGGPGEPLINPSFGFLASSFLAGGHRVHVTTNALAIAPLLEVASLCSPAALSHLTCDVAYHRGPLSLRGKEPARRVRENTERLADLGILRRVLVLMSPEACNLIDELAEELVDIKMLDKGVGIYLRRLSHTDGARHYPESYTRTELGRIQDLLERVEGAAMHPAGEVHLLPHLGAPLDLSGARCFAPMRVLNVGMDGGLWNCYAKPFRNRAQGHLRDGYALEQLYADGPPVCTYRECSCRVLGIEHCLKAHGVSLEDYCAAYHSRAGNQAAVSAIMGT